MNTDYRIKNFRVFDNEGVYVDIRPITILTGCNNSGKSSITRSLNLLYGFGEQIERDYQDGRTIKMEKYKLDFHKHPNEVLGSFRHVLHKNQEEQTTEEENKFITLQTAVESTLLGRYVNVELVFKSLEEDGLDNGYLQKYTISTIPNNKEEVSQELFIAECNGKSHWDFSSIKMPLLNILNLQHDLSQWQNEVRYAEAYGGTPNEETREKFEDAINKTFQEVGPYAAIKMCQWHAFGGFSNHKYTNGITGPILKDSNSFSIYDYIDWGLFCFFPFIEKLKDATKEDIFQKIDKELEAAHQELDDYEKKLIDLLITTFQNSGNDTFLNFASNFENQTLLIGKGGGYYTDSSFGRPSEHINWELAVIEEDDIPSKLNWQAYLASMDILDRKLSGKDNGVVFYEDVNGQHHHKMEQKVRDILDKIHDDIMSKIFVGAFSYTTISTATPKRMYSLEDNGDFEKALVKYFNVKRQLANQPISPFNRFVNKHTKYVPDTFLNKWISQFGLAHRVKIEAHADGYGVTIRLYQAEDDDKGMLLCEKGYGATQLLSILLKIENAIIEAEYQNLVHEPVLDGIGEGLCEYIGVYSKIFPTTIALEEPENHLHPSMQSKLAEMMVDAYSSYGINFLIETHSEYVVRKLQLLTAEKTVSSDSVSILYVNPVDRPKYMEHITNIGLAENGTLQHEFGSGFFDESLRLANALFNPIAEDDNEE